MMPLLCLNIADIEQLAVLSGLHNPFSRVGGLGVVRQIIARNHLQLD